MMLPLKRDETLSAERYPTHKEKIRWILEQKKLLGEKFPRIAVFVVAYNASKTLAETLGRIPAELLPVIEEIFVFDDFSADNTFDIGLRMMKQQRWAERLKVYKNLKNLGYGGNQKVGFRYGITRGFDFIILLHGDGQYAPELLPDMMYPVLAEGKKVVFGSRMINPFMALKGKMPLYKWVGNQVLTWFENMVLGLKMSEFHSGYRLYATEILKRIHFEENTNGFHFDTQIIIQCRALGTDIHEIPIPTYYGDEICYVNGMKYAFQVCKSVLDYRFHQLRFFHVSKYVVDPLTPYVLKKSRFSSHRIIAERIPEGAVVLDVGCGPGLLSRELKGRGAYVVGMDSLSREGVFGKLDEYHRVNLEDVESFALNRRFDYIVLADVIEHIRNPERLLKELSKYLKPKGRIIVSTGNVAIWFCRLSLLLGRFNYGARGILDRTHVQLYTVDSFKRFLMNCGFCIVSSSFTSLPFEIVFRSTGKSRLIKLLDWFYYRCVRFWPKFFAYQVVVEAELSSLDTAGGEGQIFNFNAGFPNDNGKAQK